MLVRRSSYRLCACRNLAHHCFLCRQSSDSEKIVLHLGIDCLAPNIKLLRTLLFGSRPYTSIRHNDLGGTSWRIHISLRCLCHLRYENFWVFARFGHDRIDIHAVFRHLVCLFCWKPKCLSHFIWRFTTQGSKLTFKQKKQEGSGSFTSELRWFRWPSPRSDNHTALGQGFDLLLKTFIAPRALLLGMQP